MRATLFQGPATKPPGFDSRRLGADVRVALLLIASIGGLCAVPGAGAQTIRNSATANTGDVSLNDAGATATLTRFGSVATSVVAEITPNLVLAGSTGNAFVYTVLPRIGPGDSGVREVRIVAPPGYSNLLTTQIRVGGQPLIASRTAPGLGEYRADVSGQTVSITLGTKVTTTLTPIETTFRADVPDSAGIADFASLVADASLTLDAAPGDADGRSDNSNGITVEVLRPQEVVLAVESLPNKTKVLVGEVVTYTVPVRNTVTEDVDSVWIEAEVPRGFKYMKGSARLDGASIADPEGVQTLRFPIGTVSALVDENGNGTADPGETGYLAISYRLVTGSGATSGKYVSETVATDFCETCFISNVAEAEIRVVPDSDFDLGTIIGKVFDDKDGDEWQDDGEPGIAGAMVALDDGSYVIADEYGRFHFPAVNPGHRLLKVNLSSIPGALETTTEESRIVWVTPGLLMKANFGVRLDPEPDSIGSMAVPGLSIVGDLDTPPVKILGNTTDLTLVVNGNLVEVPTGTVTMTQGPHVDNLEIKGDGLRAPASFVVMLSAHEGIEEWRLKLWNAAQEEIHRVEGLGAPPDAITWDGRIESAELEPGMLVQYQLELELEDGSRATSPRGTFGVIRSSVISMNLTGEAFESNSAKLTAGAIEALTSAIPILEAHPKEQIFVEGHTDSLGAREHNHELSYRRAEEAVRFFTDRGLPRSQFVVRGYGEDRPFVSNETEEGRALNRRIEIRGQLEKIEEAQILDRFRTPPQVVINDVPVPVGELGRFSMQIDDPAVHELEVLVSDSRGQSYLTRIPIPSLELIELSTPGIVPVVGGEPAPSTNGHGTNGHATNGNSAASSDSGAGLKLVARVEPGTRIRMNERELSAGEDGLLRETFDIDELKTTHGIVLQNEQGFSRIVNVRFESSSLDEEGAPLFASDEVPVLTVALPNAGAPLHTSVLAIAGETEPGNQVLANGKVIAVNADGRFAGSVNLPPGKSRLVVEVVDPEGNRGVIEREIEVATNHVFLLAFADGKVGHLERSGHLEEGEKADEFYTEGRLAYYLKGMVAGEFLVTSAFDSDRNEFDSLFGDLDGDAGARLFRNLDPDKLYPVYGDASTITYDTESQGKFYLAVENDELEFLIGNHAHDLDDTELATYRRTLYGAHLLYRSAATSAFGTPNTRLVLFGADVGQINVRNELRATGGSLYYLSHRDLVEGSEQVTILVRDRRTGLVLSRHRQRRNHDYSVKYPEGRIVFHRPISSVSLDGSLVDEELLSGNPVHIQVDFETIADAFEETAFGARVRQQIGEHVAVGGTYLEDQQSTGSYELQGVDTEIRVGGARLLGEYAESRGLDARTLRSDDGGLSFEDTAGTGDEDGAAWKVSAELDVGELVGRPDLLELGVYHKKLEPGFVSSGNFLERGTQKTGANAHFRFSVWNSLLLRYNREKLSGPESTPGMLRQTVTTSAQWDVRRERWGLKLEYLDRDREDFAGTSLDHSRYGAAQLFGELTPDLLARVEHQETFSGPDNDQTTAGVEYRAHRNLSLDVQGTDGTRGRSAQIGAIATVGDARIYLTERVAEDRAGSSNTTVLGAETPLDPGSRVYTEYQLSRTDRGPHRTTALLGVQKNWQLSEALKLALGGEISETKAEPRETIRSALSGKVSYGSDSGWDAQSRAEIRYESGDRSRTQFYTANRLDVVLTPDFTILGRYSYSRTKDNDRRVVEARLNEGSIGLAYRPVAHDRFNGLARYTRLVDQRPSGEGSLENPERTMDVVSVEGAVAVSQRLQWYSKGAARILEERMAGLPDVTTHTYLGIQRLDFRIWSPFDLGIEYRILRQSEADDTRQGWVTEFSRTIQKHLRVGVGYNFTDFSDNEFSTNDRSVRGWFVRAQGKY